MQARAQRAVQIQSAILLVGTAVYLGYSTIYVRGHVIRAAVGAATIVLLYVAARRLGPNRKPGMEPVIGFLIAAALFAMPVAGSSAPRGHGFVAAAIGSFVAQGAWALHRYPYDPTRSARRFVAAPVSERIFTAACVGVAIALALTLYVAVIFTIGLAVDRNVRTLSLLNDFLLVSLSYFAGGILGGIVVGALAPIMRWPLGAMALGIPLTAAIYGSVGVAMERMEVIVDNEEPAEIPLGAALVTLTFIGPMWGIVAKEWIED